MKVLFLVMICLVAGAQANFFTDLGNSLKSVFSTLGNAVMSELNTTGVSLLKAGVDAGKNLVSQGVQALALNTANALENANKGTKRTLSILKQVESSLHAMMDSLVQELQNSLGFLVKELNAVVQKVGELDFKTEDLFAEIDKLVGTHNLLADTFLKVVESKAENIVTSLMPKHKRNAFTEFFSGIGKTLANTFSPMVEGVKNLATAAGTAIKSGASSLLDSAKQSVAQLGVKLQPHIQALGSSLGTMAMHGANALSALKDATGDILTQTMQNMKEPLNNMANTLGNAGQTVVQHVSSQLLGNTDQTQA